MYSIFTGSLVISLLHALIPNHWLPIIAIGRKEHWATDEVIKVTLICALAHGLSTICIGAILGMLGSTLGDSVHSFSAIIAPIILVTMGLIFIYRHHRHHHFHLDSNLRKVHSKKALITTLVIAMFLSPCMEIEAYFLMAGALSQWLVVAIAIVYLLVTTMGMLLLVNLAYKKLLKLNWHKLEHNAGIITGITLIISGIIAFFA